MNEFNPEKAQAFLETVSKANNEAFTAQSTYFEAALTRNTTCMVELSDARISSYKEMAEAKTFTEAFKANQSFEVSVRDKLQKLQDTNTKAWDVLQSDIEKAYASLAPDSTEAAAPVTKSNKKAA